jgi:hypothetical protein
MIGPVPVAVAVASLILGGSPPTAAEATPAATAKSDVTYHVRLSQKPAEINADGTVSVIGWIRCSPNLYTFEYDVGVGQAAAQGSEFVSGANLPCDGKRHRFVTSVSPHEGTFSRGGADISVYVGLYYAAQDADLAAYDTVSTRLR